MNISSNILAVVAGRKLKILFKVKSIFIKKDNLTYEFKKFEKSFK